MKTNQEYKNAALAALKGSWAPAVVASIVFILTIFAISGSTSFAPALVVSPGIIAGITGASFLLSFLVVYPLECGYYNSFKVLYEEGDNKLTQNMFKLGFTNWLHIVLGYFLMMLIVLLFTLLLIIPGIVMGFAYAMTPFILVEQPETKVTDALRKSREMMKGHKFDLFFLELSFIGWILLCIITLGIGLFWLLPYMQTTIAAFYNDLKAESEAAVMQ